MYSPETPHLRSARAVAAWLRACLSEVGASAESITQGAITLRVGHHRVEWVLRLSGWYADLAPLFADPLIRAAVTDWLRTARHLSPVRPTYLATTPEPPVEAPARSTP